MGNVLPISGSPKKSFDSFDSNAIEMGKRSEIEFHFVNDIQLLPFHGLIIFYSVSQASLI